MTRLLVVRHAQSEWNAEGRWQGSADPPLSGEGVDQARRGGEVLCAAIEAGRYPGPVTSLWSSDLRRAVQTAELLGTAAGWPDPPQIVARIREHDVGSWSGLTRRAIAERWPGMIEEWGAGRLDAAPGGETRAAFDARVRAGLLSIAEGSPSGLGVVIAHGGVLRSVARWLGLPGGAFGHLDGYLLAGGGATLTLAGEVGLLAHRHDEPSPDPTV